jgi:peptidoglycan/LPS O-acetylase OafA/YrhL
MLGGVLLSALFVVVLFVPESIGPPFIVLFLCVWISFLAGLLGLHARQKGRPGGAAKWLARIGLVLAVVGLLQSVFLGLLPFLFIGFGLVLMSITTALLIMGFGLVLMGIAAIRANVLRWRALPLLMGMLGVAVWCVYEVAMQSGLGTSRFWHISAQVLVTLFGAGWVLLGHTLWSGEGSSGVGSGE